MGIGRSSLDRDLETEVWYVYDESSTDMAIKLKALELIAKIRGVGKTVKAQDTADEYDEALRIARELVNTPRK